MIKLTEQQKKDFILKVCVEEPTPSLKHMSPTVIRYNGTKDKKVFQNIYIPYLGVVYKNDIPEFGMDEIKEVFQNNFFHFTRPSNRDDHYRSYARYFDECECLELSIIQENLNRFNKKVNNDKRIPEFSFPDLYNGISWRKVEPTPTRKYYTYVREVEPLKDDGGNEIKRLFLFSDSSNVYCQTGDRVWLQHEGKYYNKKFSNVLLRILSKAEANCGTPYASIENLSKFTKAVKGMTCSSFYCFDKIYKNINERSVSEKAKEIKNYADIPLKDHIGEILATYSKPGVAYHVAVYEKVTPVVNVVRFYSVDAGISNCEERDRYYIDKDGITMIHCGKDHKGGLVLNKENYRDPCDNYYVRAKNLSILNKEDLEKDPWIGEYFKKFDTIHASSYAHRVYCHYDNVDGMAMVGALVCHRRPLGKNLFKAGYYNIAYDYCVFQEKSSNDNMLFNYTSTSVVSKKYEYDEAGMKFIDGFLKDFNKSDKIVDIKTMFFHYLRYIYDEVGTLHYENTFDNVAKVLRCITNVWNTNGRFCDFFEVNCRKYTYFRGNDNFFKNVEKSTPDGLNAFEWCLSQSDEYIELYLKAINNIRNINKELSSKSYGVYGWGTSTATFVPENYGIYKHPNYEKLKEIYRVSLNDAICKHGLKESCLK